MVPRDVFINGSIVINNDGYSIERAIWGPERVCDMKTKVDVSNTMTSAKPGIINSCFRSLEPTFPPGHLPRKRGVNLISS